jgi:ADP-heptose:LPS heptosyltransferase
MSPLLTVSIVVHNNSLLTKNCIESVLKHTDVPYHLVVTDNDSSDETHGMLLQYAAEEKLELRTNPKNLGFSVPHNKVFESCETEYFCVLNNDLEVVKGWAQKMIEQFSDPKVAEVGIKGTCIALDEEGNGVPGKEPEYVEGSCALVKTSMIKALAGGLFDPAYRFAYYEDSDLSLRIRDAGFKIAVVDLPIIHVGAATARIVKNVDLEGYKLRNKHIFMARWGVYLKGRIEKRVIRDRIVVRRGGARGDVIMTTPIVRELRRMYPKSVIVVSTVCPDVYAGNPDVNDVTMNGIPLRPTDMNYNLDMAYEVRPDVHVMKAYADVCGVTLTDWKPCLFPSDTARVVALQRLPAGPKYAIIHPGLIPGWVGRQWPPAKFIPVVEALRTMGYKTVMVGGEETPGIRADIEFRNLPFSHLIGLMERASLFVGLDSMPFHVAQACGIPSVALFGCVDPSLRIVPGSRTIGVTAEGVGCLGCHNWLPAPRTVTNQCIRGKEHCIDKLDPVDVIAAIQKLEGVPVGQEEV